MLNHNVLRCGTPRNATRYVPPCVNLYITLVVSKKRDSQGYGFSLQIRTCCVTTTYGRS